MGFKFPPSFLWGASISGYQCEGGNYNSDWSDWERKKGLEQSGEASAHYRLFENDFELAARLGLNALRFSVEWSRIFASPDRMRQEEISHYRQVAASLIKHGLKPLATLHHFSNPIWFSQTGGWLNTKNIDRFLFYLRTAVESLKESVNTWLIFNEPLVYIYNGFIRGSWPPGERSLPAARRVFGNMLAAYAAGYREIKNIYRGSVADPQVSLAKHYRIFSGCPGITFYLNSLSAYLRSRYFNFWPVNRIQQNSRLDFAAVNYYCREYVKFRGMFGVDRNNKYAGERKNQLGWYVYPQGFYRILKAVGKLGLPVIVSENGTSERDEGLYEYFLLGHLRNLARALKEGVNIQGYYWWSLIDNFEWDKGFAPRFGLYRVDYKNQRRTPRRFAQTYAAICRENAVESARGKSK